MEKSPRITGRLLIEFGFVFAALGAVASLLVEAEAYETRRRSIDGVGAWDRYRIAGEFLRFAGTAVATAGLGVYLSDGWRSLWPAVAVLMFAAVGVLLYRRD